MLLRFYNLSKSFICEKEVISPKLVSDVETGDIILSFTLQEPSSVIMPEWYAETQTQEYVVKEKNSDGQKIDFVCNLNLEDLEAKEQPSTLTFTESTIRAAATSVLNGTGWTVGTCDISKVRNATLLDSQNSLNAIKKLCTAYICEPVYDTKNKTVSFYNAVGEDRGVYFMSSLNLKSLSVKQDSYDYYTVIIPIGKDDLTIESVNDGVGYLENYQYSTKRKVLIWTDTNYTDAQALKDDAELKLESVSKPVAAYTGNIIDLAAVSDDYSILDYSLGDYVWLVDDATGTRERQRILKLTEYPDSPQNNTAEFCNLALSFDDLQSKYKAAAELVTATITNDGKFSLSDIMHIKDTPIDGSGNTIGGILRLATEAGTTADGKNKVYYSDTEPDVTNKKVGDTWFDTAHGNKVYGWNGTKWDDKQFGGDAIQNLAITNAKISNLDGSKITAGTITSLGAVTAGTFSLGNGAFVVDSNGKLTATGADIGGKITASSGTIGGFNIGASTILSQNKAVPTASDTGTRYAMTLYKHGGSSYNRAIELNKVEWKNNAASWSTPFSLLYDGTLNTSMINASGGKIGKYDITSTYLMTGSGTTATGIGGNQAFWAGNSSSNAAPFRVSYAGKLVATDAEINGKITATDGTIGGCNISSGKLQVPAANVTGTLTASQIDATNLKVAAANVTGTIKATDIDATTGKIANFTIAATGLTSVSDTAKGQLSMVHGSGYDARFEANYTYGGVKYTSKLIPQGIASYTGSTGVSLVKNPNSASWYTTNEFAIGNMLAWNSTGYGVYIQKDGELGLRRDTGGTLRLWHGTCANYVNLKCQDSDPSATYTVRLPNSSGTVALTSSDIRIKENFKDTEVDDALSVIDMIKMRSYDWTDQSRADPHQKIGFIADELEELDPKFVLEGTGGYDSDGEMNIKGVDSFYLQGYEIKAIQELHKKIIELENEIRELKGETVS